MQIRKKKDHHDVQQARLRRHAGARGQTMIKNVLENQAEEEKLEGQLKEHEKK
jgi:hypothetical protein